VRVLALVDAYNAAFRLPGKVPEDRDAARRLLVEKAKAVVRRGAVRGLARVHLVFDTLPGAARAGLAASGGPVSWSYAEGSADEAILDRVREHEARRAGVSLLVVTDDRELAGRARQLGARSMRVGAFFAAAEEAPEDRVDRPPPGLGPRLRASDFDLPEGEIDLGGPDV